MNSFWEAFQINLKRNDNQSAGRFFVATNVFAWISPKQCIVGPPEGKHFKNVSIYHTLLLKLSYFSRKNYAK